MCCTLSLPVTRLVPTCQTRSDPSPAHRGTSQRAAMSPTRRATSGSAIKRRLSLLSVLFSGKNNLYLQLRISLLTLFPASSTPLNSPSASALAGSPTPSATPSTRPVKTSVSRRNSRRKSSSLRTTPPPPASSHVPPASHLWSPSPRAPEPREACTPSLRAT